MQKGAPDAAKLRESIAYCGLVCRLCFLADKCDGCKADRSRCERDMSDQGCPQKTCCRARSMEGCWQCRELPGCTKGIYSEGEMSKVKAFALYIQKEGREAFVSDIIRNTADGLSVEKGRDYDNLRIAEVHALLKRGRGQGSA